MPFFAIVSKYSSDRIDAKSIAMSARNGASGRFSVKRTVIGSTFSTFSTMFFMPMSSKYAYVWPPVPPWNGFLSLAIRSQLKSTSSAFMSRVGLKLALLWNLTPLRSLNVKTLPSGETVHDSASAGTMLVVPISNWTRRLNIGTETASKVVPVEKNCGWKPSGLPSEQ